MEVLARGDPELQAPSLALLQAILVVPNLRLGGLPSLTHRSTFFAPLATLLQGPLSRSALQVSAWRSPHQLALGSCSKLFVVLRPVSGQLP